MTNTLPLAGSITLQQVYRLYELVDAGDAAGVADLHSADTFARASDPERSPLPDALRPAIVAELDRAVRPRSRSAGPAGRTSDGSTLAMTLS